MSRPKFIDDLAGVAGGAFSALSGLGDEVEQLIRARIDEALRGLRLVRRDEFDAVLELAANARAGQEDAALRIAALERRVAALERGGPESVSDVALGDSESATAEQLEPGPADHPAHLHAEGAAGAIPPREADEKEVPPA